jgi:glucosamine--fructose-6-phosphate aminotransferase (isomerizing)
MSDGGTRCRSIRRAASPRVRGYDSAGVALITRAGLKVHKAAGKVRQVESSLRGAEGSVGIAHTAGRRTVTERRQRASAHVD